MRQRLHRLRRRFRVWRGTEPRTRIELRSDSEEWGGWRILPQLVQPGDVVYSFDSGGDLVLERALLDRLGARIYMFDPELAVAVRSGDDELFERFRLVPVRAGAEDRPALPDDGTRGAEVRRVGSLMEAHGHRVLSLMKLGQGTAMAAIHDLVALRLDVRQLLVAVPEDILDRRARVESMAASLHKAGYRIFHIDPRGRRYSFLRSDFPGP
jgi:hypothetical protein